MGRREIEVKQSAAEGVSAIAWYIESKGMIATAEKFVDDVYDFILKLADTKKFYAICRDPERAASGFKCVTYKKKYTIVFIEDDAGLVICEFISSKLIHW